MHSVMATVPMHSDVIVARAPPPAIEVVELINGSRNSDANTVNRSVKDW
jgi:hypothetical protein